MCKDRSFQFVHPVKLNSSGNKEETVMHHACLISEENSREMGCNHCPDFYADGIVLPQCIPGPQAWKCFARCRLGKAHLLHAAPSVHICIRDKPCGTSEGPVGYGVEPLPAVAGIGEIMVFPHCAVFCVIGKGSQRKRCEILFKDSHIDYPCPTSESDRLSEQAYLMLCSCSQLFP